MNLKPPVNMFYYALYILFILSSVLFNNNDKIMTHVTTIKVAHQPQEQL